MLYITLLYSWTKIPKGAIVLQILALTDVTKSSYRQFTSAANERLLLAELSDGHSACKAIEYKPVPQLRFFKG